ncbi:DNA polymerase I [Butyrivibrio sp.]|uniref:DNA polymerase I n=2 Tax=Butyrivibrio sp. TaxID=28121 RepID=UPI0025B82B68|nr:DNA polymerase I [Butyrivibrio sp.]
MDNQLVIDGYDFFDKAFNGLPDIVNPQGEHIGAVIGFFYLLFKEVGESKCQSVDIDWSTEGQELPETFGGSFQSKTIRELLTAMGFEENGDSHYRLGTSGTEPLESKELITSATQKVILAHGLDKIVDFAGAEPQQACAACEVISTSDFNETEKIFEDIKKAYGKNSQPVGFYPLFEKNSKDELLGIALCADEAKAFFVRCEGFITRDYIAGKLQELANACRLTTFDIKKSFGLFTPNDIENKGSCIDILIGAYLLNPLKNDYMPEDIADEYLGMKIKNYADTFGKASLKESDEALVASFAGTIAQVSFLSAPLIEKKLVEEQMADLFYDIEMPLSYILYDMERVGIIAKRDQLKVYSDNLAQRIEVLEKEILAEAGTEFNINSPKQLGEVLFEKLGLPGGKKTKSGYSTAADVLDKLAPDHKIVRDVLEYRGLAKLKSTYADGLAEYIEGDGRIHTSFNQTITATGRISSTEPNLQNIPMRTEEGRSIRKVFVPKDGYVFADADYSQIELRILAHMSGDKGLIEAYHEGKDIHRITASKVFNTPFEEVTDLQRRNAKAVNFGIVYGMSTFGLSEDLSISRAEAKEYMEQYFATYPGVQQYQERAISQAKEKGYAETIYGRRRPMPELKSGAYMVRQFGERVAMNAPIQGTAADIMKIAMIKVWRRLKAEKLKSQLILQIHDELVIETAPDEIELVKAILEEEMMHAADLLVPLEVECHTGKDWYEAK